MFDDEQSEKRVTQYLVPSNVSTKFEFFEGFGWKEFRSVVIALVIGFALYFITGFIKTTEHLKISELPISQTVGLKDDENTHIVGDDLTRTKDLLPKFIRFLMIVIPTAGTYFVVRRDPSTGYSLITNLKAKKEFNKKQKLYLYKYGSGSGG